MLVPHSLPRTLRGVGGVRLIDMPGVKYPDYMFQFRKGTAQNCGKPYKVPPEPGVSSRQAADMLGVTVRSARAMLNRRQARHWLVEQRGQPACLYWERRAVEQMLNQRMPLIREIPERFCAAREACQILRVTRTSLMRYTKRRLLKEYQFRHVSASGVRRASFFRRAEVRRLAALRNAARVRSEAARLEQFRRLSGQMDGNPHKPNS